MPDAFQPTCHGDNKLKRAMEAVTRLGDRAYFNLKALTPRTVFVMVIIELRAKP